VPVRAFCIFGPLSRSPHEKGTRVIRKFSQTALRVFNAALDAARPRTSQLLRHIQRLCSAHRDQTASNSHYLAAITTAAGSLVSQTNLVDLVTALIAGLLAVHAAIRRGMQRRGDYGDPYGMWDHP
jgi:hypothetical protein